jgi:hypothetical protein
MGEVVSSEQQARDQGRATRRARIVRLAVGVVAIATVLTTVHASDAARGSFPATLAASGPAPGSSAHAASSDRQPGQQPRLSAPIQVTPGPPDPGSTGASGSPTLEASSGGRTTEPRRSSVPSAQAKATASELIASRAPISAPTPARTTVRPVPPAPPVNAAAALGGSGVTPNSALKVVSGDYLINTSNVALSNVHIIGDLTIDAPASNVTVTNAQIDGYININTDSPSSGGAGIVPANVVLSHVDAHGLSAVGFDGLTVANSRIHDVKGTVSQIASYTGSGKTWAARNLVISGSAFYGIHSPGGGAHLEALHLMAVKGVRLTGNVFDGRVADQATWNQVTATLTMEAKFQGVFNSDVTISGNTFYGGSHYQTYLLMVGNSSVTNNQFISYTSPDGSHTSSVQFPVTSYTPGANEPASGFPYFAQSGNTLDGSPVSLPGGR